MKFTVYLKKATFPLLLLLCCSGAAWSADDGQRLFDIILREFAPERAQMTLSSLPRENGLIPWIHLRLEGATVQGMRLSLLEADGFDALVSPPEQWGSIDHPEIFSMLACHAEATVTEKDVNDFLMKRAFGDRDEWRNVKVRMSGGSISASAYYIADLKLLRLKVKLELSCVLAVRRGNEFWLDDVQLKVNNAEVPSSYVTDALEDLQPVIDLKRYNLPLYISKIDFEDGFCRVRSRILPKPFEGILWQYERKTS